MPIQNFIAEIDETEELNDYLRLAIATVFDSCEEIAVKVLDRRLKYLGLHIPPLVNQEEHFPVIFIEGWFKPKEGEVNSFFNGYPRWKTFNTPEAAIEHIQNLLKKGWRRWARQFRKQFGDGYNDGFNKYDGHVGLGYGLKSCHCFPEVLAVSIIHFYYGK